MALSLEQIKEKLIKPANKNNIAKAVSLEKRLRFHTETNISPYDITEPTTVFLDWVKGLLPKDKYQIFLRLFKFPLYTPSVVEEIYKELERVFFSRNSNSNYQFTSSELLKDWQTYRTINLKAPIIWKKEGWPNVQTAINSILIVDLPAVQKTEKPEPYFYWLGIDNVIDFMSTDGVSIDWLIFKQPGNRIAVFDETGMVVYQLNDKNEITSIVSEAKHTLGYCTARFFWSDMLTRSLPMLKKNPITKELANLDWLLFFLISKRHLDTYAPYPIYSAYEADCDFENNATGDYCDGGFLRNTGGSYIIDRSGALEECPKCSQRHLAGPGSFIEVPIPREGVQDMREPVSITTIDTESLTYNVKEVERLEYKIRISCVGAGGTGAVSEKEAINETQVAANFESKTSTLINLKSNFESAQKFVDDTICKLRYGQDFMSSSIDWGTEFYVFTVQELYDKYKVAKTNGASEAELNALSTQILETEYKNNPVQLNRMLILKHLEPYRHYTLSEIMQLRSNNLISDDKLKIKANFNEYIDRFERENINIVDFGSAIEFNNKISIIYNKLKEYANEERITVQIDGPGSSEK